MNSLLKLNYRLVDCPIKNAVPILLLHGLFGSLDNLNGLARGLQPVHPLIQVDLRNHGLSPHSLAMNYSIIAQDLQQLLDYLELPEVIITGHSMGGKAAMALTALAPERISKLIVLDIAPVSYPDHQKKSIFAALNAVTQAGITERSAAQSLMRATVKDESVILFLLKSFVQGQWRFNANVLENHYQNITDWQELPPQQCPTLFIKGEKSPYIQTENHEAIFRQFPAAQLHTITDVGHWLHAEKPQQVLQAIRQFIDHTALATQSLN